MIICLFFVHSLIFQVSQLADSRSNSQHKSLRSKLILVGISLRLIMTTADRSVNNDFTLLISCLRLTSEANTVHSTSMLSEADAKWICNFPMFAVELGLSTF